MSSVVVDERRDRFGRARINEWGVLVLSNFSLEIACRIWALGRDRAGGVQVETLEWQDGSA